MVRMRSALCLALTASLVGAGASTAAPKAACDLVVDPAGDVVLEGQAYDDAALDVLGADLAGDGKRLTVVLRMGNVDQVDPKAPFGRAVYFTFTTPGGRSPMYLAASTDPALGMLYDFGSVVGTGYTTANTSGTAASGSVDPAKKTITISAPADMGGLMAPGAGRRLTGLAVRSTVLVGAARAGLVFDADAATSKASYTTGAPSCVAVAKA
jgi:hypothetical protein